MLYNTYFGSGLSSIVFQEIRESKSLAYSASSRYNMANKKNKHNSLYAYIGTQSNKLPEALTAINELLNEMPKNELQFKMAKTSVLKSLASSRISKDDIYWQFKRLEKLGISNDNRKEIYEQIQKMTLNDLETFFNEEVKNTTFDLLIIGNKNDLNFEALNGFGEVKELTPAFLFNFQ